MESRSALVGGGAGGIGRAAAEALAAKGVRVVLAGRREEPLRTAAQEIAAQTGVEVGHVLVDLADPVSSASLVERVEDRAGPIDVLVLNAGGPPPGRILVVDDDAWYAAAELLLHGPLRVTRAALPRMAGRGFGRVVAVTSGAVRRAEPQLALSVVLRSALTAAVGLLAREVAADGVTVNAVAPGATATARFTDVLAGHAAATGRSVADLAAAESAAIPAGRPADPAEIGAAIAFLASDAASYVNGTVLTVDGGRTESIW